MAGYKRTILDLEPVWFFTFDSDRFDKSTHAFEETSLIDETGNITGSMIHNENDFVTGYAAGITGHIQPEISDQHAVRFGANTRHPLSVANKLSHAPCSYFEIPYNHGGSNTWDKDELTLIWTMKKDPNPYEGWEWEGEIRKSPQVNALNETTFRLGNIVEFGVDYNRISGHTYYAKFFLQPDDKARVTITNLQSSFLSNFRALGVNPVTPGRASWCVLRYKNGIFEYFVDGNLLFEANVRSGGGYDPLLHTIPALMNLPPQGLQFEEMRFFLGGKPTNEIRRTSPKWQIVSKTEFDQISLFNKALSDDDLSRLYRRVWHRNEMLQVEKPFIYMPLNEKLSDITSDTSIKITGSASKAPPIILDDWRTLETEVTGMVLGEKGIRFPENGLMMPYQSSTGNGYLTDFFSYDKDFTLSFSFKGQTSKRAALFQCIEVSGSTELSVFMNSNNGDYSIGWMDIRVGRNEVFPFRADLSDDRWHRITIRRKENEIDAFIDSEQVVSGRRVIYRRRTPSTAMLLNSHDHDTNTGGILSEFVVYNKALNDIVLKAHLNFSSLYRVRGIVQSEGQPIKALVRLYSYKFANLLGEKYSDPTDGSYEFDLATNEKLVIMILDETQLTTRVKTVAPVSPDIIIDNIQSP